MAGAAVFGLWSASPCLAETPVAAANEVKRLELALDAQARRLEADEKLITEQTHLLEQQRLALASQQATVTRLLTESDMRAVRATSGTAETSRLARGRQRADAQGTSGRR